MGGPAWYWLGRKPRSLGGMKMEPGPFWYERDQGKTGSIKWSVAGVGLFYIGAFSLLMPMMLLLLPSARKEWKGGFGQIFRLYALSLIVLLVIWVICSIIWASQLLLWLPQPLNLAYELSIVAGFILLIAWWSMACWRFLKLAWWPLLVLSMVVFSVAGVPILNALYHVFLQDILDWVFL